MKVMVEPTSDINECYRAARATQGLDWELGMELTPKKWRRWIAAEESQIRLWQIKLSFEDVKYWVHVHFVRHGAGFDVREPFVRTQRPDSINPVEYDRDSYPQGAPISFNIYCNPQGLINVSRKRLCYRASKETREVWEAVKKELAEHENPFLVEVSRWMVPDCVYRGNTCFMSSSCGLYPRFEE